ncbi:hypothetical protein [Desulfovibrio sp. Fe33]|uniref:hypothetical protein n=1 Tax=Desulfovibrio sp. Fe33 TaxID=3020842 RepID=UPI00234E15C4|nr:hypothetical protein [Desulfovibrio sp. Fe33]
MKGNKKGGADRPTLQGDRMKKAGILIAVLIVIAIWANSHRNELAVWFNSDSFYKPIFIGDLNVLQPGSTVSAQLTPSYHVRHGFFLTFPCDDISLESYCNTEGSIRYSFLLNGIELDSKTIAIPKRPMRGQDSNGICDIALFTFDLPFQGHDSVTLKVVVESPFSKLSHYQKDIRCEVSPAYWPK